jgi:hypothetical protein
MDPVIAVIAFVVVGFSAAFSIMPLQSRREHADPGKTPDDDWIESGFALSRGDFELCRIMPTEKWTVAEFIFQDESRREFGRYTTLSRARGTILFGGRKATLYIQGSGLKRSAFAGKVGGSSDRSIVIRDDDRVLAEAFREFKNRDLEYEVRAQQRTLTIRSPRFVVFSRGTIVQGSQQVGQYRRNTGVSRKILIAIDRQLPEDLRVWICCLILLQ